MPREDGFRMYTSFAPQGDVSSFEPHQASYPLAKNWKLLILPCFELSQLVNGIDGKIHFIDDKDILYIINFYIVILNPLLCIINIRWRNSQCHQLDLKPGYFKGSKLHCLKKFLVYIKCILMGFSRTFSYIHILYFDHFHSLLSSLVLQPFPNPFPFLSKHASQLSCLYFLSVNQWVYLGLLKGASARYSCKNIAAHCIQKMPLPPPGTINCQEILTEGQGFLSPSPLHSGPMTSLKILVQQLTCPETTNDSTLLFLRLRHSSRLASQDVPWTLDVVIQKFHLGMVTQQPLVHSSLTSYVSLQKPLLTARKSVSDAESNANLWV